MMRYETSDLWLSAYLLCKGCKLEGLTGPKNKRVFILVGDVEFTSLVSDYYARRALVDPRELRSRLSDLRDLIAIGRTENGTKSKENRKDVAGSG